MDRNDGDEAKRLRQGVGQHLGFYEVGYGKPPAATRFQKGQSGNPRGRPSRQAAAPEASLSATERQFLAQLKQTVTIREGEGTRSASLLDAVIRSEMQTALKGSAIAQRNIIERAARIQAIERQEIAELNGILERWREEARAEIAKARKEGKPEPGFDLHPDDVILEPGQRPRFLGPVTDATREMVKDHVKVRDALLMQGRSKPSSIPMRTTSRWTSDVGGQASCSNWSISTCRSAGGLTTTR